MKKQTIVFGITARSGNVRHISQIDKDWVYNNTGYCWGYEKLMCPSCGKHLVANKGKTKAPYFSHKRVTSGESFCCSYANELAIYRLVANSLKRMKQIILPEINIGKWNIVNEHMGAIDAGSVYCDYFIDHNENNDQLVSLPSAVGVENYYPKEFPPRLMVNIDGIPVRIVLSFENPRFKQGVLGRKDDNLYLRKWKEENVLLIEFYDEPTFKEHGFCKELLSLNMEDYLSNKSLKRWLKSQARENAESKLKESAILVTRPSYDPYKKEYFNPNIVNKCPLYQAIPCSECSYCLRKEKTDTYYCLGSNGIRKLSDLDIPENERKETVEKIRLKNRKERDEKLEGIQRTYVQCVQKGICPNCGNKLWLARKICCQCDFRFDMVENYITWGWKR